VYVGPEIARAVGKPIVLLFRAIPATFLLVCLGGIGLGIFLLSFDAAQGKHPIVLHLFGVLMIIFYMGAFVLCAVKLWRGTWSGFCNWWLGILENL
jgi:hypothetical protein